MTDRITSTTPDRINGIDHHGERWEAHQPRHRPETITLRSHEGLIHLDHAAARALATWLLHATQPD